MDMDEHEHEQALYSILNDAFAQYVNITEMDWIMTEKPSDISSLFYKEDDMWRMKGQKDDVDSESAPFVVAQDHSSSVLGVPFWTIGPLYEASWKILQAIGDIEMDMKARTSVSHATRALLLLNGDHETAWNFRRKVLTSPENMRSIELISILIEKELQFCALVLSRHPKSDCAWAHRRWLLMRHGVAAGVNLKLLFGEEFELCDKMSEKHPRNYYAWSYRYVCIFDSLNFWISTLLLERMASEEELWNELKRSDQWIYSHISDYSAYCYRMKLIERLVRDKSESVTRFVLSTEWRFLSRQIENYPNHETHWYYRRFLLRTWIEHEHSNCGDGENAVLKFGDSRNLSFKSISISALKAELESLASSAVTVTAESEKEYAAADGSLGAKRYIDWAIRHKITS